MFRTPVYAASEPVLVFAHLDPQWLVDVNGTLFFSGRLPDSNDRSLWKSDGTTDGTQFLHSASTGSGVGVVAHLVAAGDRVFFRGETGVHGIEIWVSDGTQDGTVMVKDINPGNADSTNNDNLVVMGGIAYFVADDGTNFQQLWRSDGTEGGTLIVKQFAIDFGGPDDLTVIGDTLFFAVDDGEHGRELWKSDGTEEGTVLVKDIVTGPDGSSPSRFGVVGGRLFFAANDASDAGRELWVSDGTEAGTVLVKDINQTAPGAGGLFPLNAGRFTDVDGLAFFVADDGVHGLELWRSDGTEAGTWRVTDMDADAFDDGTANLFAALNGELIFRAEDGGLGRELWKTDGSPESAVLVKDVRPGSSGSSPRDLIAFDGAVFFRASDGSAGQEVWRTDGTPEGTALFADVRPGSNSSSPQQFAVVGSAALYFAAFHEVSAPTGTQSSLWVLRSSNLPPSIEPIEDVTIDEGVPFELTPVVTDPEGDPFTLEWSGDVPAGAIINGVFEWTPAEDQGPGDYEITLTATQDGSPGLDDTVTFVITVLEVNEPPVLDSIADQVGVTGSLVEFTATATDPDIPANTLTFSIAPVSGTLDGATIDPATGAFSCECATGEHVVEVIVSDGDLEDSQQVTITVQDLQADLSASISVIGGDPDEDGVVTVGTVVGYAAVVSNLGPDPAANTEMVIWLPGTVTEADLSGVPSTCEFFQGGSVGFPSQLTCGLGTIGTEVLDNFAGITFQLTTPGTPVDPFTVLVDRVTSDAADPNEANNTDSVTLQVRAFLADLASSTIITSGDPDDDGIVEHGTVVGYSVIVENLGPDPATNAQATIWLPSDITEADLNAVPLGCAFFQGGLTLPTQLTCDLGTIGTGVFDFKSVAFEVTMPSTNRDPFTVQVFTLESDEFDPDESNNQSQMDIIVAPPAPAVADLRSSVTVFSGDDDGDGIVTVNSLVGFSIVAENLGPDPAENTRIAIWLPGDVDEDDLNAVPLGCTFTEGGLTLPSQLTCDLGTVGTDVFEHGSVGFVVRMPSTSRPAFTVSVASLTSDADDPDEGNNTSEASVEVRALLADLEATLAVSSGDPDGDGEVTHGTVVGYTATAANLGPDPATDVRMVIWLPGDIVEADLAAVPLGCQFFGGGTQLPSQLDCDLGTIGTGVFDWQTVTFSVTMPSTNRDPFTVSVASLTSDEFDPDEDNNTPAVDLAVVPPEDGDGIEWAIDGFFDGSVFTSEASVFSDRFTDQHLGGTTFGEILDRAGRQLSVADAPAASRGTRVRASAGTGVAEVRVCEEFDVRLKGPGMVQLTCGSLLAEVIEGEATIVLADGTTVDVPEGATVEITEQGEGSWAVEVLEGGGVVITHGGETEVLDEGDPPWTTPDGSDNTAPVAEPGGPYLGAVNTDVPLDGRGSSDADGDALTYAWTSSGGTLAGAATATPTFSAAAPDVYVLTLEVCDTSDACHTAETTVVVYDPSGGFVTGGGWIDSPAGACGAAAPEGVCDGDPEGRATFAFVSKFKRGADVPDGQTRFMFNAGNLRFEADAYQWLVVAGQNRAQFKGTGSINGEGGYEFMLTAYDGKPDGFRIKITLDGEVVYDNKPGSSDSLGQGNTQAIGGGSIVIHTR